VLYNGHDLPLKVAVRWTASEAGTTPCPCRYSAQRQQFGPPGSAEVAVLDYQTQQQKLLPLLATCYALHFAKGVLVDKYCEAKRTKVGWRAGTACLPACLRLVCGLPEQRPALFQQARSAVPTPCPCRPYVPAMITPPSTAPARQDADNPPRAHPTPHRTPTPWRRPT
jgi:hypothetical protein